MERWAGKIAVVTGASEGIGAAIAIAIANSGINVVGFARRPHLIDKLQEEVTGKGRIHSRQCDIGKPEQITEAFQWVDEQFGGVDILVNNAAVNYHGDITDFGPTTLSETEILNLFDINLRGTVLCARQAITSMKKRNFDGHIININSIAGHYIPFLPILNVYTSTKYGITAFSQALLSELNTYGSRIRVTSISPGIVATRMAEVERIPTATEIAKTFPKLQPCDVADTVIYAISTPPTVNISEITIQPVGEKRI